MDFNKHLFIVGAQKSGTSTLFDILNKSNDIISATKENGKSLKELHYFDRTDDPNYDQYLKHFNVQSNSWLIDATPVYMFFEDVPIKIQNTIPKNAIKKIIVILRNPIDRAVSQYKMNVRMQKEAFPFHEAIREEDLRTKTNKDNLSLYSYKKRGLYYEQIKRLQDHFGKENVLILIFEKFIKNPKKSINQIIKYLEIPDFDFRMSHRNSSTANKKNPYINKLLRILPISNNSKYRLIRLITMLKIKKVKPIYSDEDYQLMTRYFKEDMIQLEHLLGYKIKEWR